ncbi:MAG TPA: intradiol ring-cleavage dioxygenase [Cyclobacteriaceae bacterium]|nr:intradiol ring-cleavage dioxygenase [Cyclobacteriaceae bacterium]
MRLLLLSVFAIVIFACDGQPQANDRRVGDGCDGCELMYEGMPTSMSWETRLVPATEPGEPMIIEGTIYKKDGKTPAPGVILYVYHTDAKGYYSNLPNEKGNRHGHLKGWMKTGADGKYKFTSIRPAPYPDGDNPAHVHPLIKEPGMTLYWIDEYLFEDDPLVTEKVRKQEHKRGGKGIIQLVKKDGVWRGTRDIVLGMNVPNY